MANGSPLKAWEPLIGVWDTEIEIIDDDGQRTLSHAVDAYRWALDGKFIFHDVDGEMAGQSIKALEIIGEAGPNDFALTSYDNSGAVEHFTAQVGGGKWTITGESIRFDGQLEPDGNSLAGKWDQRRSGDWRHWLNVTLRKRQLTNSNGAE